MANACGVYEGLEPAELWRHFAALNGIPRPSGGEGAAIGQVATVADAAGASVQRDARGNLVIRVAAADGHEAAPIVALQAHLDMVCEKRPDVTHHFATDPIRARVADGWVYASGTTLGADNGIGAAAALALMTDPTVTHGPLELVFTVEEETGLHGAAALDPAAIRARLMINLDSEDPEELTVGCAGGAGSVLHLPVAVCHAPDDARAFELRVSGLRGGHSGVQIHERLANANKLLVAVLQAVRRAVPSLEIDAIEGGNAHNAIPRDAAAGIFVAAAEVPELRETVAAASAALRAEWGADEPGLAVGLTEIGLDEGEPAPVMARAHRDRLLDLLSALPHGVLTWSEAFPGKVETSSNLATLRTNGEPPGAVEVEIGTSTRSFDPDELARVQGEIGALAQGAGASVDVRDGYPGWEPDPHSWLLRLAAEAFAEVNGVAAKVEVIHAGLECGVIVSKLPGMEAVSFGPRIRGAHTPEECVEIASVASTWRLLRALLEKLARCAQT